MGETAIVVGMDSNIRSRFVCMAFDAANVVQFATIGERDFFDVAVSTADGWRQFLSACRIAGLDSRCRACIAQRIRRGQANQRDYRYWYLDY